MKQNWFLMILLPALAMSVGWGFRGDYGHEAGAMIPGALAILAAILVSKREDWLGRFVLLAFLGSVGWAIGGQMSYGKVVGYTMHSHFHEAVYGFACLFLIGALWGGIGGAIVGLGLTLPKKELLNFGLPLAALYVFWKILDFSGVTTLLLRSYSFHASDWVAAISTLPVAMYFYLCHPRFRLAAQFLALLASSWLLGLALLVLLFGLRMTPPRGDNWAGCVGLFIGLIFFLKQQGCRPGLTLALFGFLAGGIGFALGDFIQVLGRGKWGPISHPLLQGLDYWKWMEQSFGLIMGAGIGFGFWKLRFSPIVENEGRGALDWLALFFLMFLMFWENFFKNIRNWKEQGLLTQELFGISIPGWFLILGIAMGGMLLWAFYLYSQRRLPLADLTPQGIAQFLFLWILWLAVIGALTQVLPGFRGKGVMLVHASFWLSAMACTCLVFPKRDFGLPTKVVSTSPSLVACLIAIGMGVIVVFGLGWAATSFHNNPLPGAQTRFE